MRACKQAPAAEESAILWKPSFYPICWDNILRVLGINRQLLKKKMALQIGEYIYIYHHNTVQESEEDMSLKEAWHKPG